MGAIAKILRARATASTCLNFASKLSKGQILRVVESFYDQSIPLYFEPLAKYVTLVTCDRSGALIREFKTRVYGKRQTAEGTT